MQKGMLGLLILLHYIVAATFLRALSSKRDVLLILECTRELMSRTRHKKEWSNDMITFHCKHFAYVVLSKIRLILWFTITLGTCDVMPNGRHFGSHLGFRLTKSFN